jgi:hypothetical protein
MISSLTASNSSSLFLFSVLTSYFALATPRLTSSSSRSKDASIPAWLFLIQGTRSILRQKSDSIKSGTFSTMVLNLHDLKIWTAPPFTNEAFESLHYLITSSVTENRLCSASANVCSTSLGLLAKMFTVASQEVGSSDYVRQILLWMMVVPDEFITLVQEHVPEALCIFAYYCVPLKRLDDLWFMQGWSRDLIENIYFLLGRSYRGYLAWPMQEIG